MKNSNYLIWVFTLVFLCFGLSCSKDEETEPEQQQSEAPTLNTKTVIAPETMTQSQDQGAQQTVGYIEMANAFTGLASSMAPPTKSGFCKSGNDGPPWVYTWEVNDQTGNYTVTLTITENDSENAWNMVINGTMDGIILNNFTLMEAEQSNDGISGSYTYYDPETQEIGMIVTWDTDSSGVYTVTFETPGDVKIIITTYPNGSGQIEVYEWENNNYQLVFEAQWDESGHGEWVSYTNGVEDDHGEW